MLTVFYLVVESSETLCFQGLKPKFTLSDCISLNLCVCGVRGSCTIERVECSTANLKEMSWNKGSLSRKDKIGRFGVRNWLFKSL